MAASYESILRDVESLSHPEQLRLLEDLAEHLRLHAPPERRASILELQGLGRESWAGIDAQKYVDGERASWNG